MSAKMKDIHIGIAASLLVHLCFVLLLVVLNARLDSNGWQVIPVNLTLLHDGSENAAGFRRAGDAKEGTGYRRKSDGTERKDVAPSQRQHLSSERLDGDRSDDPKPVSSVALKSDGVVAHDRGESMDGRVEVSLADTRISDGTLQFNSGSGAMNGFGGRHAGIAGSTEGPSAGGEPQGGKDYVAIRDAIIKNIRYPEGARKKGLEGRVLLSFVVLEDGSTAQIKVVQSSGYGVLDEEARRVVAKTRIVKRVQSTRAVLLPVMYSLGHSRPAL